MTTPTIAVPRELLERSAYLLELGELDGPTARELRALLTAQPQASAEIPFAGFDPNFCPGSNPENPQTKEDEPEQASAAQNQCGECGFPNGAGPHCGYHGTAQSAPAGELWAVHAQGPDDLYAAFSREDAERHASELNAIPAPEGVRVSAVVVQSPWSPAEHWQYLAEQEREQSAAGLAKVRQLQTLLSDLAQEA